MKKKNKLYGAGWPKGLFERMVEVNQGCNKYIDGLYKRRNRLKITLNTDLGKQYRFKKNYDRMYPKGTIVTLISFREYKFDFLLYVNQTERVGILLTPKDVNKFLEEVKPVTIYRKVKKGVKK